MPVLNGYEATEILRKKGDAIPIIAITANAIKGENIRCIEAGMNDYISKPFKEEDFLNTIAKWLVRTPNLSDDVIETAENMAESSEPLFDLSSLKTISRGNEAFILKMVNLFCEQTPPIIKEMISAYKANDLEKMGALAHKIKPTFDNLKIQLLKEDIRTIETAGKENRALPNLKELLGKIEQTTEKVIHQMKQDFPG